MLLSTTALRNQINTSTGRVEVGSAFVSSRPLGHNNAHNTMPRQQAQDAPYTPNEAPEDVIIVRLGAPTGSNNFNSTGADGVERLVELPAKIRKMTLASRGMFAFVQLFEQSDTRVAGEVTHVISPQEIKSWRKTGEWWVLAGN